MNPPQPSHSQLSALNSSPVSYLLSPVSASMFSLPSLHVNCIQTYITLSFSGALLLDTYEASLRLYEDRHFLFTLINSVYSSVMRSILCVVKNSR